MSADPATPSPASFPPVKRREIFGWCCFDFANSAFTTIIITVVYSLYFESVVAAGDARAAGWWGTTLAVSQLIVLVLAPVVGAMGDVTARKKRHLLVSAVVCSAATFALTFVGAGQMALALALVLLANVAFSLGENICSAFLPELSTPQNAGRISGYGWSFGYVGGLVSLVLALAILKYDEGLVPWTFAMTGVFFVAACTPTLLLLRERAHPRPRLPGVTYFGLAFAQIRSLRRELPAHRTLAAFFAAMTLYMAGLTAIVAFAALYAGNVVGMTTPEIIQLFVVLQLSGIAGAFAFGFVQDRVGAKFTLVCSLLLWVTVCIVAANVTTKTAFYGVAFFAGFGMGSLQSAGRAVVSTLTPPGRQGEFFGYWGLFSKLAAVLGPGTFGWMVTHHGYPAAILANGIFFLAGLLVLLPLNLRPVHRHA